LGQSDAGCFPLAHGRYLLAVTGPEEWTETAIQILKIAVEESGAGAKTAAGYGRMRLEIKKPPEKIKWEPMIQGLGLGNAGDVVRPVSSVCCKATSGAKRRTP